MFWAREDRRFARPTASRSGNRRVLIVRLSDLAGRREDRRDLPGPEHGDFHARPRDRSDERHRRSRARRNAPAPARDRFHDQVAVPGEGLRHPGTRNADGNARVCLRRARGVRPHASRSARHGPSRGVARHAPLRTMDRDDGRPSRSVRTVRLHDAEGEHRPAPPGEEGREADRGDRAEPPGLDEAEHGAGPLRSRRA